MIIWLVFISGLSIASAAEEVCGFPGLPFNGQLLGIQPKLNSNFPVGTVITYGCKGSLKLLGNPQRRCECNGRWSGVLPRCVETVDVKEDLSTVLFIAGQKALLSQEADLVNGLKSYDDMGNAIPFQRSIPCGSPAIPSRAGGRFIIDQNGTWRFIYQCELGYYSRKPTQITCGPDGKWSGDLPECLPLELNPPSARSASDGTSSIVAHVSIPAGAAVQVAAEISAPSLLLTKIQLSIQSESSTSNKAMNSKFHAKRSSSSVPMTGKNTMENLGGISSLPEEELQTIVYLSIYNCIVLFIILLLLVAVAFGIVCSKSNGKHETKNLLWQLRDFVNKTTLQAKSSVKNCPTGLYNI